MHSFGNSSARPGKKIEPHTLGSGQGGILRDGEILNGVWVWEA